MNLSDKSDETGSVSAGPVLTMDEQPFQVGDVVRLVSGSPPLAVTYIEGDGKSITISWFANGVIQEWTLVPEVLVLYNEQDEDTDVPERKRCL